ncbi:MAG: DUF5666 domain-containing protein [Terriglobales bacterium]|jgi:hypothetical protein|nr:DUF5666 domain-containing protein [Terriglobales bacterium]
MLGSHKFSSRLSIPLILLALIALGGAVYGQTPANDAASTAVSRAVGAVKSINGNQITLTTDTGPEASILFQDSTRILRTAPGQNSLKGATAIPLQELQVGDRLLVRGTPSSDAKSIVASIAIVMKQSDVAATHEQQKEAWQKHGIGGLVKSVNPDDGTIQISIASFAGTKDQAIHTSKSTVVRRYAPDSVKFDDAKPSTLAQIKPGDQLRARGTRGEDGTQFDAEEIVSGSFRNIAGIVSSIDAGQNTLSVMDLITKTPVTVKITTDSQVRQLPAMLAQRIAMRLKGGTGQDGTGSAGTGGAPNAGVPGSGAPQDGSAAQRGAWRNGGGPPGATRGGPPDFQQMLSRLPAATLGDLHKGDAVMIVATEGSASSAPTAITMLSGVEPLLTASPDKNRASTLLSPWNLGASPEGGDAAAQ